LFHTFACREEFAKSPEDEGINTIPASGAWGGTLTEHPIGEHAAIALNPSLHSKGIQTAQSPTHKVRANARSVSW